MLSIYLEQAQKGTWWNDPVPRRSNEKKRRQRAESMAETGEEIMGILNRQGQTIVGDIAAELEITTQSVRSAAAKLIEAGKVKRVVVGVYIALDKA